MVRGDGRGEVREGKARGSIGLALSSLAHVMRSLTPNAQSIFLLLARYQLENKVQTFQGMIGEIKG